MGVYTIIGKNFPKHLEIEKDFPKCQCGGEMRVQDNFDRKGDFHGTTAQCKECGEYFIDDNYAQLKKRMPEYQERRKHLALIPRLK